MQLQIADVISTWAVAGDQIKNEMGGACGTYGRAEKCLYGFGEETWGKAPLGRPRRRWEDNINTFAASYLNP